MENVISAQEIKRRGISAVDEALARGPVHVIRRNRPSYVILSEAEYQRLLNRREAGARLWEQLLRGQTPGQRSAESIHQQMQDERGSWDP